MITNKKFALAFRSISLILGLSGVLVSAFGADGVFKVRIFRYYTLQSNVIAVMLFAVLLYKTLRSTGGHNVGVGFFPRLEMIVVVDVLLTFIIYWVLLAPGAFSMGTTKSLFSYSNLSVHLITPLLCLVDYILFTSSNHLKHIDVYLVTVFPLFYVALSSVLGFSGQVYGTNAADGMPVRFPYFFFDYDRIGWFALVYILGITIFFVFLSHLFYLFDKKIVKKVILK